MVRTPETVFDRHVTGTQVDQIGRDEERTDSPGAAFIQQDGGFRYAGKATRTGADCNACTLLLFLGLRNPAGIRDSLLGGGDGADDETVHLAPVFAGYPVVFVEVAVFSVTRRQRAGNLAG